MCDVQLQRHGQGFLFAKNSDREASEPQPVRRLPAVRSDTASTVQTTYLTIPQSANRYAVALSQPGWIWGAEMGANEPGVVIGNTAVFSRLATAEKGLIGMDLLRLGLERGSDAREAMQVIVEHLQTYGQGGPCGYRNKGFLYDNAFLIADAHEAWQLETAGRHWVACRVTEHAAISNCLSIGSQYDLASVGIEDFARRQGWLRAGETFDFAKSFETTVMPVVSGARMRRRLSMQCLTQGTRGASLATMMAQLRTHNPATKNLRHNHDVCMHAGGLTRPSQATAAMVADTSVDGLRMLMTGTSATCRSVFRPLRLDAESWSVLSEDLWARHESVQRRMALGMLDDAEFIHQRDAWERSVLTALDGPVDTLRQLDAQIDQWHGRWVERARTLAWRYTRARPSHWYWQRMNRLDDVA